MNDLQQKIEAVRQEIEAVGEGIEAVRQGVEAESRRNIRYRRFMIMPQCFDYLGMAWNGIGGREMFTVPNDEENPVSSRLLSCRSVCTMAWHVYSL